MDAAAQMHHELVMAGISFTVAGDKLQLRPAGVATPEQLERLRAHKSEIIRRLAESDRHHQRTKSTRPFSNKTENVLTIPRNP